MTVDEMPTSPGVSQGNKGNLEGDSNNLSEVTQGFFPGTPSCCIVCVISCKWTS